MRWMTNGYEEIKKYLLEQIDNKVLLHTYLFEGDASSGKRRLAEELACELLDTKHLENCSDFTVMGKDQMNMEGARRLIADTYVEPFKDKKIYLVDNAADLTVPMQNALLKTLEEPPDYAHFFLLCDNRGTLLETLQSRCVHFYFPPGQPVDGATRESEKEDTVTKSEEEKQKIVSFAGKFYEILAQRDELAIIRGIDKLKSEKNLLPQILEELIFQAGTLLRNKVSETDKNEVAEQRHEDFSEKKESERYESKITLFEVLRFIDIIEEARRKIESRCSSNTVMEVMLIDILEVLE